MAHLNDPPCNPATARELSTRIRSTKASGSFSCTTYGSYELLTHMEADPQIETYCEFDFLSVLAHDEAAWLASSAAYLVTHRDSRYVLCVTPPAMQTPNFANAWRKADRALAMRQVWLLSRNIKSLRSQPRWQNALLIARCAGATVSPTDTTRITQHLGGTGSASFGECIRLCRDSEDSFDAVLKLVSAGILWLDLDLDISAGSCIRLLANAAAGAVIRF